MKRKNRIRKNNDFKKIISEHHVYKTNEYTFYFAKNNLGYARVGVSVSSKIGNAVKRNKIKRQIKYMLKDLIKLDQNNDVVIIVRDGFKQNTFQQNFDSLNKALKELR